MRSAQYHCTVQYIFQRVEERHQCNRGISFERHSAPDWGTWSRLQLSSDVFCVMGMASVSWFYLFNIQVRANCTTACNIQAALQYVELTHVSSSVNFFLYLVSFYKKMCMQLGIVSKVMLAPPLSWWEESQGRTEDERWCCLSRQISLIGYFDIHSDAQGKLWAILPVCLFVCLLKSRQRNEPNQWWEPFFLFLTICFFQKVRLFVVKKSSSCACV